jgi:hypothetical protein
VSSSSECGNSSIFQFPRIPFFGSWDYQTGRPYSAAIRYELLIPREWRVDIVPCVSGTDHLTKIIWFTWSDLGCISVPICAVKMKILAKDSQGGGRDNRYV